MSLKLSFRQIVDRANRRMPVRTAAIVLAATTVISALLGIYRDRLLNANYLDTYPTGLDAYTAAFVIPDFIYLFLITGALSVTFIPVLNQRLANNNKKAAWEMSSSLLNFFAIITLVASILIMIFAEPLIHYVVGPGLDEASRALAVSMTRIISINPFLFGIATVLANIQQAVGRFAFYAFSPVLYNLGIIIGIVWFTGGINIFGWQIFDGGIIGVALGVVLGAVLQFLFCLIGLFGLGFDYRFKINWRSRGFRKVLSLLPARSADQGLDYVNSMVEINLASHFQAGAIRSYQQALSLERMPTHLIGVALSTAYFPTLTEDLATGNEAKFRSDFRRAIRYVFWLSLPVAVITFFARGFVVQFIKVGGDQLIADILAILVISLLCSSIFYTIVRGFYAHQDTKTPFLVSLFAIGINIALAVFFSLVLDLGPYGLAFAHSIGSALELIILMIILSRRFAGIFDKTFRHALYKMFFAAAICGVVTYFFVRTFPFLASETSFFMTFPKFFLIASVGLLTYALVSVALGLSEISPIKNRIIKFFKGGPK